MKYIKKLLLLALVLCLVLAILPTNAAAASETYNFSGTLVGLNATYTYSMTLEEDALVTINNHGSSHTAVMLHKPGTNWMTDYIGGDGDYQLKAGTYWLTAYVRASAVVESEFYYAFSVTISTHTCSYKKDKVVSPTCSARGYTLYVCSCGNTKKDNYVDKLPHDEWNSAEVPATCQETGRTAGIYCTICGATISGRDTIPKTDHAYVNNACIYCGQLTGICGDDLQWTLDPDGKLTVIGTGDMYSYEMGGNPWKAYTDRITSVSLPNGLTSIGSFAFQCLEVSGITIPDTVTAIGEGAFLGCQMLTKITIPNSVTQLDMFAFSGCSALKQVTLSRNLTEIPAFLFIRCSSLTSVTIPDSVTTLGNGVFSNCTALKQITLPDGITGIPDDFFLGCTALTAVTIPESVTSIGDSSFADCSAMTQIQIPVSVTSVGELAFSGCTGLTRIDICGDAPAVGTDAFEGVTAMVHYHAAADGWADVVTQNYGGSIVWDAETHIFEKAQVIQPTCSEQGYSIYACICGAEKLDDYTDPEHAFISNYICPVCKNVGLAGRQSGKDTIWTYDTETATLTFSGSASLQDDYVESWSGFAKVVKRVVLDEGITAICTNAFRSFSALEKIEAPGVKSVGAYAFFNCTALREFTGNVTVVSDSAFRLCENLRNVVLSDAVTVIGQHAFASCSNLESIQFSGNLTSISDYAFFYCHNLKEITIPDTVTWIGVQAFCGCKSLTELILPSSLEGWDFYAFMDCYRLRTVTIKTTLGGGYAQSPFPGCGKLSDVFFTGNAPSAIKSWFDDTSAVGYYPSSQDSWKQYIKNFKENTCLYLIPYNPCSIHSFGEWTETIAPTCSLVGVETRTCSHCGYYRARPIDKISHSWDDGVVTKAPTETSEGKMQFTCTVCGTKETQPIPKLEHVHVYEIAVVEPTCTEPGYSLHTCACGYSYTDTEVPATEHSFGEWGTVTAPTCTEAGEEERFCRVCSVREVREIPALNHSFTTEIVAPTCTEEGYTVYTCHCGEQVIDDIVPATGHQGGMATCIRGALCEVCGTAYGEKDPENHLGGREILNKVDATEFSDGYSGDIYCADCGKLLEKGTVIPATHVHNYTEEWTSNAENHWHACSCGEKSDLAAHASKTEANCASAAVCDACGVSYGAKDPANHTGNTEIRDHVEAEEFKDGYSGDVYCADCGKLLEKGTVIPATHVHSYAEEWTSNVENHWHVCACGEKSDLAAHIPGAEPTETSPQVCTVCNWELKPAIIHTHKPQKMEAKDATHTENGNKEYYICSCGEWYEDAAGTKLIKNHASVLLLKFELGDVDHDYRLTSMDAMLLMQYKAGLLAVDFQFCTECADVDGRMGINSMDAMLILQFRAGLITSFR